MTNFQTYRPPLMGTTHMVNAGHYLAAAAGYRILEDGGNAVDAGVASGIAINVVIPENTNFGGVAPIIIYLAESDSVVTISGLGRWPRAASIEYFRKHCDNDLPPGILRAVVPSAPDAWLTALERYGTMTLEQVITPALELARDGFPVSQFVRDEMESQFSNNPVWPGNRSIFMPGRKVPAAGERLVQSALATTFERLIEAERNHAGGSRGDAIRAARDFFYRGELARDMARFSEEQDGLLGYEDLHDFSVGHEPPVQGTYRDYEIFTCGPWCQGPVVAQVLQMLENDDLTKLGHNSGDYIHLVSQALNLAFADREHHYGDPDFVDVPIERLTHSDYTRERRGLINMDTAFPELPRPGLVEGEIKVIGARLADQGPTTTVRSDTSYTCVVDRWGNAFSATPSDQNTLNPIIPELGFSLSCRGYQNWLEPDHASSLQPWKRPRLTPNPAIAFKHGKLFMPFGCPGGDAQCQAMVQAFLNIVAFGMNPQAAVEQPRFTSWNFPNSFWPHEYLPGRLNLESRIDQTIAEDLRKRGHDIGITEAWVMMMGVMSVITVDPDTGILSAGADPRRDTYAMGR